MLTSFFVLCDYSERAAPALMSQPMLGGFIKGGLCATVAWAVAWPVEVVKSKVQGAAAEQYRGQSTTAMLRAIVQSDGVAGLYRGFLPGAGSKVRSNVQSNVRSNVLCSALIRGQRRRYGSVPADTKHEDRLTRAVEFGRL